MKKIYFLILLNLISISQSQILGIKIFSKAELQKLNETSDNLKSSLDKFFNDLSNKKIVNWNAPDKSALIGLLQQVNDFLVSTDSSDFPKLLKKINGDEKDLTKYLFEQAKMLQEKITRNEVETSIKENAIKDFLETFNYRLTQISSEAKAIKTYRDSTEIAKTFFIYLATNFFGKINKKIEKDLVGILNNLNKYDKQQLEKNQKELNEKQLKEELEKKDKEKDLKEKPEYLSAQIGRSLAIIFKTDLDNVNPKNYLDSWNKTISEVATFLSKYNYKKTLEPIIDANNNLTQIIYDLFDNKKYPEKIINIFNQNIKKLEDKIRSYKEKITNDLSVKEKQIKELGINILTNMTNILEKLKSNFIKYQSSEKPVVNEQEPAQKPSEQEAPIGLNYEQTVSKIEVDFKQLQEKIVKYAIKLYGAKQETPEFKIYGEKLEAIKDQIKTLIDYYSKELKNINLRIKFMQEKPTLSNDKQYPADIFDDIQTRYILNYYKDVANLIIKTKDEISKQTFIITDKKKIQKEILILITEINNALNKTIKDFGFELVIKQSPEYKKLNP